MTRSHDVPAALEGPWYAQNPWMLDEATRDALTAWAREPQDVRAGDLSRTLEGAIAADPAAAFSFDAAGHATLHAGGRTHAAGRFEVPTLGDLLARQRGRLQAASNGDGARASG